MGGWVSVFGPRGLMLCCMALSASEVYHLTIDNLTQVSSERRLDSSGPVRTLQQQLAERVKSNQLETSRDDKMAQTDLVNNLVEPVPQNVGCCSRRCGMDIKSQVLVELMRRVPPLSSEEPEDILLSSSGWRKFRI